MGSSMNRIAKLRKSTNGETTAKVNMSTKEVMPGIRLAVSYEFAFLGEILRPEYVTNMAEYMITTRVQGVWSKLISRRY
jgi:hypothetical protein